MRHLRQLIDSIRIAFWAFRNASELDQVRNALIDLPKRQVGLGWGSEDVFPLQEDLRPILRTMPVLRDKCAYCDGTSGVLGNENISGEGKPLCDYCHAAGLGFAPTPTIWVARMK